MKSKMLLLQAIELLLLLLLHHRCQANTCQLLPGTETLQVGETKYEFVVENGVGICEVSTCCCIDSPFLQASSDEEYCSDVSDDCSVLLTPHERNLSICCKHCSECDFLTCPQYSNCTEDSVMGAQCQCFQGYSEVMSNGQLSCIDIDECANGSHNCSLNSDCVNVPGRFECSCHSGYHGDDCDDIDECTDYPGICPESTMCENHDGFYKCVCNEECSLDINSYYLTPPNDPAEFFDHNQGCSLDHESFPGQSMVVCTGQQQLLTDHSTEADIPPAPNQYVGWDRNQGDLDGFTIIIDANHTRLTRLDVHFYHNPSAGIGLPEVSSIYVSSSKVGDTFVGPLSFIYSRNEDLAQSDTRIRTVSIIITDNLDSIGFYQFVRINFAFSSSNVWRTQLTEIQAYGGTGFTEVDKEITFLSGSNQVVRLEANDVVSKVDLSCTVANSGTFLWEWTRASDGAVLNSNMTLADLTRTSILTIDKLSMEDSGDYVCRVFHSNKSLALERTDTITLDLAYETIKNGPAEPTQGSQVTLSCEFVGYSPKEGSRVEWDFEGRGLKPEGEKYSVSNSAGNSGRLQNGGTSPDPSLFSSLTISTLEDEDIGIYGCRVIGNYSCSQLIGYIQVGTGPVPCPSAEPVSAGPLPCLASEPLPCPSTAPTDSFMNNNVWFFAFVVETVLIIVMMLVIVVVIGYCKHQSGTGGYKTPFPELTRPNKDGQNGDDLPDGTDDKMYEHINGIDWTKLNESKV